MAPRSSPSIRRRELGNLLRYYREARGLTATQAATELEVNPSLISRLENAQRRPGIIYVRALCRLYDLDGPTTDHLVALTRQSQESGWWQRYDLESPTATYLSLESAARSISNFEVTVVPGLLQTPEYAAAVIKPVRSSFSNDQIGQRVESRIARQQILTGDTPVELHAIVDEGVLYRTLADPPMMAGQLRQLQKLSALPHVTLQILEFSAQPSPALDGGFTVMTFAEPSIAGVVYSEGQLGQAFQDKASEVARAERTFQAVAAVSADPEQSLTIIEDRIRAISRHP